MAGGKETPRQKMIGMMYLVLTALLALNVSKSILDAFVAIEENIQISNENEYARGMEKVDELKEKALDKSVPDAQKKAVKLLKVIEEIDKMTALRIKEIDDLKLEILNECAEDTKTTGTEESIIKTAYNTKEPLKPIRMKLTHVQGKDKYDEPMRIMIGLDTDIKKPKGKGLDMFTNMNKYRNKLVELIVSSSSTEEKKYSFKAPDIKDFKNGTELTAMIDKVMKKAQISPDDYEIVKKIYTSLTKDELSEVHEQSDVHWVGKTFDHAPSVAALASLSSLQKEILTARADAVTVIRQRVGGGEYSFNKIMALAYGPELVNQGDEVEVQVLMAAFDSDKQPIVTVSGGSLRETKEGKGFITTKGSGTEMKLTGTITILNKSGIAKTLPWDKTIKVMKPSGTVSLPDMNVLYRAYDNKVEGVASGYEETVLTGTGVTLNKAGGKGGYIGRVNTTGREATITIAGRNNITKKTETLGKFPFRVMNLPAPALYLGSLSNGSTESPSTVKSMTFLRSGYPPEIPLNVTFGVGQWEVSVTGAPRSIQGTGKMLSAEALSLIKQAKPGSTVSITAKFTGPTSGFTACSVKIK